MGKFADRLDTLLANMLDSTVDITTQSSSELAANMPPATDIKNQNLVRAELLKLNAKIEKIDTEGKAKEPLASRYFIDHYREFMVGIREFAQKNAEQTNAATITQAMTFMDALWSDIVRSDPIAKQLERIELFLEAYSAKLQAETKLKDPYESGLNRLKNEAKTFVAGMNDKPVSTLETTLNTYDEQFVKLRSEIENPGDPATLKAGVTDPFYTGFVRTSEAKVEQVAANPTPSTLWYDLKRTLSETLPFAILIFVSLFFAILVANDKIHLSKYYRIFYFFFVFILCAVPGPNIYAVPLLGFYYFFKRFLYDSFKRDDTATFGVSRDYVNGITLYALLPIQALQTSGNFLYAYNELLAPTKQVEIGKTKDGNPSYESVVVGPSAKEKQFAYLQESAKIVGATLAGAASVGPSLGQLQALLQKLVGEKEQSDLQGLQKQLQTLSGSVVQTDLAKLQVALRELSTSS